MTQQIWKTHVDGPDTRPATVPPRVAGAWLALVLLCLDTPAATGQWTAGPGFRRAPLAPALAHGRNGAGFTPIPAPSIGIGFTNALTAERVQQFQNAMNGSGVAAGDIDQDGWCDLFFCNKDGASGLFRNLGNGSFEDVSASAGVRCTNQVSAGAVFGDVNGDGFPDLVVSAFGGPNALLINNGKGQFTDMTAKAGLVGQTGATSLAMADLDGDGDLDLYVCNFGVVSILRDGGKISTRMMNGKPVVTGRHANRIRIIDGFLTEFGEPDALYWNDGHGVFTQADWTTTFSGEDGRPMTAPSDFGLAVQIRDVNGDGLPDIYVCNDFQTPDRLWINQGGGRFRAIASMALRNMSFASMGVDFADIDRDGHLDFITVEMLSRNHAHHLQQSSPMRPVSRTPGVHMEREDMPRNNLFRNRGDGTFEELAYFAGVAATDWSWAPIFLDVDLDGYEDLLVSNGHLRDVNFRDVNESGPVDATRAVQETRGNMNRYPPLNSPKYAFRNRGDLTFEDVSGRWGFNSTLIAHGMCLIDLDHDGDLDVVMNAVNSGPLIYRNESTAPRVAIRLKGRRSNPEGVGARITVSTPGLPPQTQEMLAGGRYLSGDESLRVFAAGRSDARMAIDVVWPGGRQSHVADASPGFLYEIDEAAARAVEAAPVPSRPPPLFEDISARLNHRHVQPPFDDFAVQPLLPRKLSQSGPAIAFSDLNGDGHEDVIIGSGQGGVSSVLMGDGKGGFAAAEPGLPPAMDDVVALSVYRDSDQGAVLMVAQANHRTRDPGRSPVAQFIIRNGTATPGKPIAAPFPGVSPGCVAMADVDGDGDLDLFVGGWFRPGRYPEDTSSWVYRNNAGTFELDPENTTAIRSASRVTAAVWTDLDSDGFPELVVSCEWGPVRVHRNDHGRLRETTADLGLASHTGWWTCITTGDFDADGRPDLLVGNRGLNGPQTVWGQTPYLAYYGDFAEDSTIQIVEAFEDRSLGKIVPFRDFTVLRPAIPSLRARIESHAQYARMSVQEILGPDIARASVLQVNTLASCLFLNRGSRFEKVILPREAQMSPVNGVVVGDMDNDGREDAFLSQNCFAVRNDDSRLDSGRGLWLRGDGAGQLVPVPGDRSGVIIYGEGRGCALADVNEDGRIDLMVGENGGPTHLYLNRTPKTGVRVRLKGPAGNRSGIGAQLRVESGGRPGPVRETHAGSGRGSQDGEVQVMAAPGETNVLEVLWPGGRKTRHAMPAGTLEMVAELPQEYR